MKVLFSIAAIAMIAGVASAQNISKFVISDEAAKKSLIKNEISAETAEKITQACVEFAKKNNIAVSVSSLVQQVRLSMRIAWTGRCRSTSRLRS